MKKPAFIVIGAAKSGTTSIYHYLSQHPKVFMSPIKEPNYFALKDGLEYKAESVGKGYEKGFCFNADQYLSLFENAEKNQICGEASPIYLWYENAAKNIYEFDSEIKIIVCLRNPVDRAYSNFKHHLQTGMESTKKFSKALELEYKRKQENWWWGYYYFEAGLYYTQIRRYFDLLQRDQIKIIFFEEFISDKQKTMDDLCEFLEVDSILFKEEEEKRNTTYYPKLLLLEKFKRTKIYSQFIMKLIPSPIRKKIKKYNSSRKALKPEVRDELTMRYRYEINRLERLTNKDLSLWYK